MAAQSIITIGNFDGVHVGHRAILDRARQLAQQRGATFKAITFEPHPATVLCPQQPHFRIIDAAEKRARLDNAGADQTIVLQPTRGLMEQQPQKFVETMGKEHQPIAIVEGSNFRFGKSRSGDVALLRTLGEKIGFETVVVDPVEVVLADLFITTVSSTLVRRLVGDGRVLDAGRCLGQPFALSGIVTTGDKRGGTIGVPTANLDMSHFVDRLIPADGVYGGYVQLQDNRTFAAAISVGVKPTFQGAVRCIEAHLLDFDDDIYNQTIAVEFTRWLRDQRPFAGTDALAAQLHRDVADVRRYDQSGLLEIDYNPAAVASTGT